MTPSEGQRVGTRLRVARQLHGNVIQTLATARAYNAFGEATQETDARNNTTYFSYNKMGRTTAITRPTVQIVSESGGAANAAPVEHAYFDLGGRLIGSKDANGNITARNLLAGTGYGGSEALTMREFHADGGQKAYAYSAFGDLRHIEDEIGRDTVIGYDAMGRKTQVTHNNGLVETFAYDQLGRQVQHVNAVLGTAETGYDIMGRVVRREAFATDGNGDVTTYAHVWNNALSSGPLGAYGGWTVTATYANAKTSSETSDQFGRQLARTDLGGHSWTMSYDLAGRLAARAGLAIAGRPFWNA